MLTSINIDTMRKRAQKKIFFLILTVEVNKHKDIQCIRTKKKTKEYLENLVLIMNLL